MNSPGAGKHFPFFGMWLFVAMVSLYDGYLVRQNQDVIAQVEENPICLYLIDVDRGNPSLLLRSKALGTAAALLVLLALRLRQARLAMPVAVAVAIFQFGLLLYLTLDAPPGLRQQVAWGG